MSRLESIRVEFESVPYPTSRHPPPLTRSVLPSLTKLAFDGVHEYLEDLLAQLEAPLLDHLKIAFFTDVNFVVPQLHQLIAQAESFKKHHIAVVYSSVRGILFAVFSGIYQLPQLSLRIRCRESDRQLASLAQVCNSSLSLLSTLVRLDIANAPSNRIDGMETARWPEILDPFTSVTDLRLANHVALNLCLALAELAEERATEVLPALQNISIGGWEYFPTSIDGFVAARQLSGQPIAVRHWNDWPLTSGLYKHLDFVS